MPICLALVGLYVANLWCDASDADTTANGNAQQCQHGHGFAKPKAKATRLLSGDVYTLAEGKLTVHFTRMRHAPPA